MKKIIMSLAFIASLPYNVSAFTITGSGVGSCGTWVEDRKTDHRWYQAGQWVNGYLAGAMDQTGIELKEVDPDAILVWLDKYCKENPLDSMAEASRGLFHALETK